MKAVNLFRVSLRGKDDGEHKGYKFFGTCSQADAFIAEHANWLECSMDSVSFPLAKRGFIAMLNHLAGHPDNG